jgi:hypothetical protein
MRIGNGFADKELKEFGHQLKEFKAMGDYWVSRGERDSETKAREFQQRTGSEE